MLITANEARQASLRSILNELDESLDLTRTLEHISEDIQKASKNGRFSIEFAYANVYDISDEQVKYLNKLSNGITRQLQLNGYGVVVERDYIRETDISGQKSWRQCPVMEPKIPMWLFNISW